MDRASGTPPLPRPRPAPRTPIGSGAPSAASFRLDTGGGALSPQPALDGALRGLLAAAIPRLIDAAGGLRPRALLLLGSAAAGEACGVEAGGGRWIPLSDIDLALIVDSAPRAAERARVRDAVALALERERARLGLAADPLDIAIVARRALRELPVTIEWAEAFARPTLLWGELSGPAGEAGAFRPPFEALRLLLNRIAELALESSGPAPTGGEAPADWPASPEERDWRRAHRWAKLPLDAWKAWLAARGEIEPSAAGRLVFLEGMGRAECMERMERPERPESPERPEPPAPAETPERPGRTEHPRAASRPPGAAALDAAAPGWRGLVADWTAWRLRPAWPPPQADPAAVGALADAVLGDLLSGLIGEDFRWSEARHWRLALAAEGGSARERLRRWRAVLASRPGGVGRARAARLAIRWRRAWPASLGILVAGLAWTAAVRRPEEAPALRARLAREFPLCQDPGNGAGEAASPGVPGRLAGWLRSGGGLRAVAQRILLVFLIDALGHRLVRETGAFSFLQGAEAPVASVCGYSSACIPSLLTGRRPREHGHWAMYLCDSERSVFRPYRGLIRVLASWLGRHFLTRRLLTRLLRRRIRGYFSLYEIPSDLLTRLDLCEKADIFAPGAFPGIETPFDAAQRLGVPYRAWHWNTGEEERRRRFEEALREGRERMLFFYSPLLDAVMHAEGTRGEGARRCLAQIEAWIASMLALARARGLEARLLVCGDHGMADVTGTHEILPELEALPLRAPEDFLYFVDSTMVRVWYRRPGAREMVEALLRAKPFGRLIDGEERRRLGIDFPDGRYGETIFLMNAGEILAPSFMGRTAPQAMHGYHPEDPDSDTVVLTSFDRPPIGSIRDIGPLLVREIEALAGEGR